MIGVRQISMPRHRWLSVTVPVCELQQSYFNAVAATQPSDARCWKVDEEDVLIRRPIGAKEIKLCVNHHAVINVLAACISLRAA